MNNPRVIEKPYLKNGHPVIDWKQDRTREGFIVLVDISLANAYHPYAVWRCDKEGNTFIGDYCRTLTEARLFFAERS